MRLRGQVRLLAVITATAAVLAVAHSSAAASPRGPAPDKLVVLAGSPGYVAYAEYPALDAHHADFADGELHVLNARGHDRDLGSSFGDPDQRSLDPYKYSLVSSMLTGYSAADPTHVEWWNLADRRSGLGTLPDGTTWQGSAPGGWVETDGTTLAVESVTGAVASYGSPVGGPIDAVSGPLGVVSVDSASGAMAYQPWASPSTLVTLDPGTITDPVSFRCDSASGAVVSCVDTKPDGSSSREIAVPLDGSASRTYPGCGVGSVALGIEDVFVCGGPPAHPRFAEAPETVSTSSVAVRPVAGVSAFGDFVTVTPGRDSVIEIANQRSHAAALVRVPGPIATLDAASLRAAASAVETEALRSGALRQAPAYPFPAQILQSSSDALIAVARAHDPSLAPVDTRRVMGRVPGALVHHSRRRPRHLHITATHTLARFTHAVPDRGSGGIGVHRRHGGSAPAVFQKPDGVYVDPHLARPRDSTVGMVALRAALKKLGQPYIWAAAGPSTFDCSGLVQWAYAHAGIRLTHFSGSQWNEGRLISPRDILPGDLILFDHLIDHHEVIHHVGLYLGAGWMVNAPFTGQYVDIVRITSGGRRGSPVGSRDSNRFDRVAMTIPQADSAVPRVRLDRDGPLALITMSNPPLNLFDEAMVTSLRDAVNSVGASDARGLLIQAEGRAVSAGVDVNLFAPLTPSAATALWREWFDMIHAIAELPMPTVFAAHGLCLTAAFEVSLACDLLLATEAARFGLVEIVVGLTPSMGGPQRLAERAGPARAKELIYSGDLYDARTLEGWNVVNRVLPAEGFAAAAHAFALALANGPTRAHAATKAIIREQLAHGTVAADEVTPQISGALFGTADLQNAVTSFLRDGPGKATFTGH
jgi:enoyl-CoA hydratase